MAADRVGTYPGPKARALIERMRRVEGAGPRAGAGDPLVVDHASGATLVDPDGNRYTDLAGSFAAASIGHSHPEVAVAVAAQIGVASHVSSAAISEGRIAFEEDLVGIAPPGLDRVLLGITGADANDTAVKLARSKSGRREIMTFAGGYFGRTRGVAGLNGKSVFRTRTGVDPDAHFLPYPDPYRWPTSSADRTPPARPRSRSYGRRSRILDRASGRSQRSWSRPSRAAAGSSSHPTFSSPACERCAMSTASCSSSTRSSVASGARAGCGQQSTGASCPT